MSAHPRTILWVSLGLNIALLALLYDSFRKPAQSARIELPPPVVSPALSQVKTNFLIRRQNFAWPEIESSDYRSYIANLRAIDCPESTIRDIIVAEVNTLYDRKRATEVVMPEQQWWRQEPDPSPLDDAMEQFAALDAERRALLTELLGPNWDVPNLAEVAAFNLRLDGPVLGALPDRVKQALREIETRFAQRRDAYLESQQKAGKLVDPAELLRLEAGKRKELAEVLTPPALEQYLLRYSTTAQRLRADLHGFEVSPEEFREMFRSREPIEDQSLLFASANDPGSIKRREAFDAQREAAIKQVLGSARYRLYRLNGDPIFHETQTSIQQIGAPAEVVLPIYQINQATAKERERIRGDTTLTLEQRAAAWATMVAQQQESLRKLLGSEAYVKYREASRQ